MRDMIAFGEGKDRAAMHFTDDVRRRGDAEAAVLGENGCSSACSGVFRVQKGEQELELELK
jgi:hypothetical protein